MLCTVQTTHGRNYAGAGLDFGPVPLRLWVGDKPPMRSIRCVSAETWAQIKDAARRAGNILQIVEDVSLEGARQDDQINELQDQLTSLQGELATARGTVEQLTGELEGQRTHGARVERDRDSLRLELEALRAANAGLKKELHGQRTRAGRLEARLRRLSSEDEEVEGEDEQDDDDDDEDGNP
ncbi:MAG: hypothetical protein MJE77_30320 [Proteobacteria bacterium]|nr:hypothetical protein [Pseudomonadota bacterium]